MSLFQSNSRKQIRNLPKFLNFVKKIHYLSKLFTGVLRYCETLSGYDGTHDLGIMVDLFTLWWEGSRGIPGLFGQLQAIALLSWQIRWSSRCAVALDRLATCAKLKCNSLQNVCKFLAGSFSAVSKRNFARKYAFDRIFQALQDLHTFCTAAISKFSQKIGLKNQQFS